MRWLTELGGELAAQKAHLKRAEALLAAEKRTLEMIASGACLADILERLCETVDAQASNIKSAVMLMDTDGMHLRTAAGPRLANGWIDAITPLEIGPTVGSCGSAAFMKQRVIVSDIATDPLWANLSRPCFKLRVARGVVSAATFQKPARAWHFWNVLHRAPHPK